MKVLFCIFFFISTMISAQTDTIKYNFNDAITGSTASNTKQTNFSFIGDNGLNYKNIGWNNTTNYTVSWINKKIAEDLTHRSNLTYKNWFCLYVYNHSLTRAIAYDNAIGLGYVHKWKYFSLSYGVMYQKTGFYVNPSTQVYRHSLRAKFKYKVKRFQFGCEYYYQPNIKQMDDVIFYGNAKTTFFVNDKIGISISDVINFRSLSTTRMIHAASIGLTIAIANND